MNLDGCCPALGGEGGYNGEAASFSSPGGRVGAAGVGGRAPGARAHGGGVALHGGSVRLVVVGVGQLAAPSRAERARGS